MRGDEVDGQDGGELQVRPLRVEDLEEVARVHLAAFPRSELGRLGSEAVRRNYVWQFEGPHDLTAIGVWDRGRLVGFLFGGVFRGSTIGFVKRERWFLLGRVLRHPGMIVRRASLERLGLAAKLLARRMSPPAPERPEAVPPSSFGILSIAVDPVAQGSGIGQRLVALAEREARAGGFARMHLTVHPDNARAVEFYERGGWTRSATGGGPWVGQMVKVLA